MSHVSDSDHRRLDAVVFPDHCVVESHQISDAARGLRRVPVTRVWRTERLLGRGGFGEVHLQSQESDKDAKRALKVIPTRGVKLSLADCHRELTAMIELTKPKYRDAAVFVDFIGWFQNDDAMFLAMEYMPLGDLEQNVQDIEKSPKHIGPPLSEEEVQEISRQILEGLKIMHAEGFAHRDLKPQNVFVVQKQPQWWVKLGDFGLSKKRTDGTAYRTQAGTQQYMAPEIFYYVQELDTETSEYTSAIDLWSLGCIIYRLLTGVVPFPSLLSLRNYCRDQSKVPLNMQPTMEEAGKFVQNLLIPHPAKRPLASAALESLWLTLKNKPKINDLGASFAALNISQSQNNYNTGSHKGLKSYNSLPPANGSPINPFASGSASEPIPSLTSETLSKTTKAGPLSKLHDDHKQRTAEVDTMKRNPHLDFDSTPSDSSIQSPKSQPTRTPASTLATGFSDNELLTKPRKHLSVQAPQGQGQSPPVIKDDAIGSTPPRAASEPPLLALPVPEPYPDSTDVKPTMVQISYIAPDQTPDRGIPTTNEGTLSEGTSKPRQVAKDNNGPLFLHPRKPGHSIDPFMDYDEGYQASADPNTAEDAVAGWPRYLVAGKRVEDAAAEYRKRLHNNNVKPTAKDPDSVIGDVLHVVDVPDPAMATSATGKRPKVHLPKPTQIKKYPPAAPTDRETMQISDIKAIFDSYGVPYYEGFTKSQLLYILDQTFPVSGAPGCQLHYDIPSNKFSWEGPPGSLPPGWVGLVSRAGEKYYYDTVNKTSTWNNPRITESKDSGKSRSEPVLPQNISGPQMPPSRPRPLEAGKLHPTKLPEGWTAESATFNEGRSDGWKYINTLTGRAEQFALPNEPANAPDITHVQQSGSTTPRRTNFWMKALYDFDPQYDADLRFSKGDMIRVIEGQDGKTPQDGWLIGEVNGRKGTFPANYCLMAVWMKALHDFDPQDEGDLRLSAGDLIQIIDTPNSKTLPPGWLVGKVGERRGTFPSNYCEIVPAAPGPSESGQILGSYENMLDNVILTGQVVPDLRLSFITTKDQVLFTQLFKSAVGKETTLSGDTARDMLWQSGLDASTLSYIWMLADTTKSGKLYFPEFALAMFLCNMALAGNPIPQPLPENITREIAKLVDWIISCEPTDARPSASGTKPPDSNMWHGLEPTSGPQQLHPGPSTTFPVQQNDTQRGYGRPLSQNSTAQPQHDPQDPYVHPSLPLSQPYASTLSQDDGRSSQPITQGIFSKLLSPSKELTQLLPTLYLYIKTMGGRTIKLVVTRQDTIDVVKRKLEALEGYVAEDQNLIFAGRQLDNNRTVADYNIKHENTIHLVMQLRGGLAEPKRSESPAENNKFKVYVQGEGADMIMDVQAYDTCRMLKEKIFEATRIPVHIQILTQGYRFMDDAKTLRSYQITSGDVISLRRKDLAELSH